MTEKLSGSIEVRRWYNLLLVALTATACGCGSADFENRQAVEGAVTMDGQPLPKALITFIPNSGTAGPKATGVIVDGKYEIHQSFGPCPGEFTVKIETITPEIEALSSGDYEALHRSVGQESVMVAPEYNRDSQLQASVTDGGPNRFDYSVESAK